MPVVVVSRGAARYASLPDVTPEFTTPAPASMSPGDTYQLEWTVLNADGEDVTELVAVSFGTTNHGVATVSATGVITAVASGACVISLYAGRRSVSGTITVVSPAVVPASISGPSAASGSAGASSVLSYQILDGTSNPLTGLSPTADTADHSKATVTSVVASGLNYLVTVSCLATTAGVNVTVTLGALTKVTGLVVSAAPSGGKTPNLPAGGNVWTQISDVTWDNVAKLPPASASAWDANRWQRASTPGSILIQSLAGLGMPSTPIYVDGGGGSDLALIGKFGAGGTGTPFKAMVQHTNSASTVYQEEYYLWYFMLKSDFDAVIDFSTAQGTKFGYFQPIGGNGTCKPNHFHSRPRGTPYRTRFQRQWTGSCDPTPLGSAFNGGIAIAVNTWYRLENWIKSSSAVGVADGHFKQWIDGVPSIDTGNIIMNPALQAGPATTGWRGYSWEPIRGKPQDAVDTYMAIARAITMVRN